MKYLFFCLLPKEIRDEFPSNILLRIIYPLYGITESGTYWFNIYWNYYLTKLGIRTSLYDTCLLITKEATNKSKVGFVGIQTDNTLILGGPSFIKKEEHKKAKAELIAKEISILEPGKSLDFNRTIIEFDKTSINLVIRQKGQGKLLELL